jgi:DivIVA domain-containing protein
MTPSPSGSSDHLIPAPRFATARRGYDRGAVADFLREVAEARAAGRAPSPDAVATRTFPTARHGFAVEEVRVHLARLALALAGAAASPAAADDSTAHPPAAVDPLAHAGEEVTAVLRAAHEAAGAIVGRAEAEAVTRREDARRQVETRLAELDREIAQREREATERLDRLRREAEELERLRLDAEASAEGRRRAALDEAQHRLDEVLRTERAVQERLRAALESATAAVAASGVAPVPGPAPAPPAPARAEAPASPADAPEEVPPSGGPTTARSDGAPPSITPRATASAPPAPRGSEGVGSRTAHPHTAGAETAGPETVAGSVARAVRRRAHRLD